MDIVLNLLLLIACFAILIKGADFMVDAASYIAKAAKVPSLIIGLTIVAFGTSCPEAGVSVVSSLNGANSLSISNVVGSNAFNLLVVIGISALLSTIAVEKDVLKLDYPICLFASVLMVIFCFDNYFSRLEGAILVVLIVLYVSYLVYRARKNKAAIEAAEAENSTGPVIYSKRRIVLRIGIIILCIGAIYLSSQGIVHSCSFFAKLFGVSDTIIGLTIVALGTSLPELVTSLVAYKKGENSIAIGNIVGSNLYNILFVLGLAGTISPLSLTRENLVDSGICLVITLVCYIIFLTKGKVGKAEGVLMLGMYVLYMVYAFLREFEMLPF